MPLLTIKNPEDFYEKLKLNSSNYINVISNGEKIKLFGFDGNCYYEPIEVSEIHFEKLDAEIVVKVENDIELSLEETEEDVFLFYFNEIPTLIVAYQSFEYKSDYNSVKYLIFTIFKDKNLDYLKEFKNLESLVLTHVYKKDNLNEIGELGKLKYLKLSDIFVKDFSFLEHLINLEKLIIKKCHLNSISGIENCKNLKELDISRCYYLNNVSEIQYLVNLEKLRFYNYWSTFDVSWLLPMKNLVDLSVSFYSCMLNNHLFLELTNLKRLHLSDIVIYNGCKHHVKNRKPIKDFSNLVNFKNLEYLFIMEDPKFIKNPISQLKTLKELNYYDKKSNFNFISNLENLEYLDLSSCNKLQDISFLKKIMKLKYLNLNYTNVSDISVLENLTELEELNLDIRTAVFDITPISKLINLKKLDISVKNDKNYPVFTNKMKLKEFFGTLNDINYLYNFPNIEFITLDLDLIQDDYSVLETLQKLKRIYIKSSKNQNIDQLISTISKIHKIKEISFKNVTINDLSPILKLKYLEELEFYDCICDNYSIIGEIKSVRKLVLNSIYPIDLKFVKEMDKLIELNVSNQPIENLYEINDAIQIKNICHEDTKFTLQFQIQSATARNDKKFIDDNLDTWLSNFNFEKRKVNKMMAEIFKKTSDVTQIEFNFEYGKFNKTEEIHFIKLILKAALLIKIDEFIKISKIVNAIYERSFDDESIPEIINSYTKLLLKQDKVLRMKALKLFNFEELKSPKEILIPMLEVMKESELDLSMKRWYNKNVKWLAEIK